MSAGRVAAAFARMKGWPWLTIGKIAGAIVVVVIVVLVYRHIFVVPDRLRQEGAQARQDTKAAQGEVTVTHEAMEAMQQRAERQEVTRTIVRENTREIRSAPGAADRVPPAVHNAGVASIRRLRQQADQHPVTSD